MFIEKDIEDKLVAALSTIDGVSVTGPWQLSDEGTVKGEETPANRISIGVAVSAPVWDAYLVPTCSISVALSIVVRREVSPTAADLARVCDPITRLLLSLQLNIETVDELLSTSSFSADGVRLDGGQPPVFDSSANTWRVVRSFTVRGVAALPTNN